MFAVFCTKDKTGSNWCGQIVYKVPEICHGHQDRIKEKSVEGSVGTEQLNSFKNDRQLQAIRKHPSKMLTVCLQTVHASVSTRLSAVGREWGSWKGGPESGMGGFGSSTVKPNALRLLVTRDPDDTHDWKHCLPATSLAGGDNAVLVFDRPYWQGCLDVGSHQAFNFSNIVQTDCKIVLIPIAYGSLTWKRTVCNTY